MQTWLVTGGAGFIGSCFIRSTMLDKDIHILNLDKLTYAGHLESLPNLPLDRYQFCHAGIEDSAIVARLFENFRPSAVINFAAESHVDRSIDTPAEFLQTNVVGTVKLLEQTLSYYRKLSESERTEFRFLHVSTDEVYGSLGPEGRFTEQSPYQPNSPYAASKASSDMFVRAFRETYELPTLITNCSNNYGPYQFPEKLIPLVTLNAAEGKELPVYGDGSNIRDWLYVEDHCDAIRKVLAKGKVGETYNVGGDAERTNLQVVTTICDLVDEFLKRSPSDASSKQIRFVKDRPGHDKRYAIDASKIKQELGWSPQVNFEEGLRRTVHWYLSPNPWIEAVSRGKYQRQRLGTA